jgi:hypothetical protein
MFTRVPPVALHSVWEKVEGLLEPAIVANGAGEETVEEVLAGLLQNLSQLWIKVDGERIAFAVVTRLLRKPAGLACVILYAGGTEVKRWMLEAEEAIREFAIANGCMALELHGRRGWEKLIAGIRPSVYVYRKELRH